jgi:cytochrome c1
VAAGPRTRTVALILALGAGGCGSGVSNGEGGVVAGGDPQRGADVIRARECGTCHVIPGIRGAEGHVAAPLTQMGRRTFIAGILTNEPDAMVKWILDPQALDPQTAMPDLGLSEQQARDAAAYLYTLR